MQSHQLKVAGKKLESPYFHNFYETESSIDVEEYHRALENILDRKIEIQKSLRAVMRIW